MAAPKTRPPKHPFALIPSRAKADSGNDYAIYPQGNLMFDFVLKRPSENRADIFLCIPSAFTTPANKVDGVCISHGVGSNEHDINRDLGGAMVIEGGKCRLLSTNKGELLTAKLLRGVSKANGSLFQQFLIVHDFKPASFRDKSKFQRRAVCESSQQDFCIIESVEPITFKTFNDDLVSMGIKEALYCDMGAWSEGWYRSGLLKKITKIGQDRSLTKRQSNWLLLRAPTPSVR